MNLALRALNRFGLGARPGEAAELADPRGWVRSQIGSEAARLAPASGAPPTTDLVGTLARLRSAQRARDQEAQLAARRELRRLRAADVQAALTQRLATDAPFAERLVAFWSNHLCISAQAIDVGALAGDYEREVIRAHVFGRFTDMVLASARHPAMLLYLDNARSIGPRSRRAVAAARRGRTRGLNENYARELLELHTLGVDGGYTQDDVVELAKILSGWGTQGTMAGAHPGDPSAFAFREVMHEPGAKTVLGVRYAEAGVEEGERVIADLCAHPATARHIALKLVRHFVADEPPPAAVERLEQAYLDSGGDLAQMSAALCDLSEAWDPAHTKFRSPQDWLVAAFRALDAREALPEMGLRLRQMRHPLWTPPAPNGFGDRRRDWADPDALMNRGELARRIGGSVRDRGPTPHRLGEVVDVGEGDPLPTMLGDESIPRAERTALALAGPAFQWR